MRWFAVTAVVTTISACGPGGGDASKAPTTPPRVLSDADRAGILASLPAPYDQGDLENGRAVFARCRSCHTITEGGPNMTGPNLYGVFGRIAGTHPGYSYSTAVKAAGFAWDAGRLNNWLQNPRTFMPGTKMSFAGLPDATDRRDVIAWLKVETGYEPSADKTPVPVTAPAS